MERMASSKKRPRNLKVMQSILKACFTSNAQNNHILFYCVVRAADSSLLQLTVRTNKRLYLESWKLIQILKVMSKCLRYTQAASTQQTTTFKRGNYNYYGDLLLLIEASQKSLGWNWSSYNFQYGMGKNDASMGQEPKYAILLIDCMDLSMYVEIFCWQCSSDTHGYRRLPACKIADAAIILGQQLSVDTSPPNGLQRRSRSLSTEAICCRRASSSKISFLQHVPNSHYQFPTLYIKVPGHRCQSRQSTTSITVVQKLISKKLEFICTLDLLFLPYSIILKPKMSLVMSLVVQRKIKMFAFLVHQVVQRILTLILLNTPIKSLKYVKAGYAETVDIERKQFLSFVVGIQRFCGRTRV